MNEQRPTHDWSVVAQQETTGQAASGAYVRGVNVSFSTSKGISGSVFIPDTMYNAEAVAAAIEQRVRAMADVHALGGSL